MTDTLPAPPEATALVARLGHVFADERLLTLALRHRSYCAEHGGESNERLEFLGDSILGLVVTDHVFHRFGDKPESELSKIRAAVVSGETLADVARQIGLGKHLLLGKGEQRTGGADRTSILSDAMEALFGGIYLDGGWNQAAAVILGLVGERIEAAALGPGSHEYKSQLQELAARLDEVPPKYVVTEDDGPPHDKRYFATVRLGDRIVGDGEGRSKKQAETAAARQAWERLMLEHPEPTTAGGESAATDAVVGEDA